MFIQARGKKRQVGWFPATYVKPLTSSSNRSTPVSHGYQDSPTDPNIGKLSYNFLPKYIFMFKLNFNT